MVIGGSFVLEQTTNSHGQARTVLAISGGHLDLSPSLTGVLTGIEGALLVTSGGLAAQVSGTVNLGGVLPDAASCRTAWTWRARSTLALNRTTEAIDETVDGRATAR